MKFTINHDTPANKFGYGIIPADKRGEIKSTKNWRQSDARPLDRKPTNKEYGSQNGMSSRQASKKRRGY